MPRLLALLALLAFAHARAAADFTYLAIGDSSAFGETNRTRNPSDGDRGYVRPFADALAQINGGVRPDVVNLAINGETSGSFFSGVGRVSADGQGFNTNYNGLPVPYTQAQRLGDLFGDPTAAGAVRVITVQLGANNLDAAAADPAFLSLSPAEQQAAIAAVLGQVQADYTALLFDLRDRFPTADLYVLGYHNPYNGAPELPISALADPAVRGLNQVVAGVGSAFGARYVDVYGAIHPNEVELTLIRTYVSDPLNFVHLNDSGYEAAGDALIGTAGLTPVPAPSGIALAGVAVFGVLLRRKAAASGPRKRAGEAC